MDTVEYFLFIFSVIIIVALILIILKNSRSQFWPLRIFIDETPRWQIFLFVAIVWLYLVIGLLYSLNSPLIQDILSPKLTNENLSEYDRQHWVAINTEISNFQVNRWRSIVQMVPIIIGLPIAFLLWFWRDRNVRDQIANARRETSLKEFLEVQARAAGIFIEKSTKESNNKMQIASLHQLRIYISKKFGEEFQRPALELLLASHAVSMDEIGTKQLENRSIREKNVTRKDQLNPDTFFDRLRKADKRVVLETMGLLRDEAEALFTSKIKLEGRNFDLLDLIIPATDKTINFSGSSFLHTDLKSSKLAKHDFSLCRLHGTDFRGTNWSDAIFSGADIDDYTQLNNDPSVEWKDVSENEKALLREKMTLLIDTSIVTPNRHVQQGSGDESEAIIDRATKILPLRKKKAPINRSPPPSPRNVVRRNGD